MRLELEGRLAVVTGASGDIGAACAEALAAEGARVRLSGRDPARLEAVASRLPGAELVAGDLTDDAVLSRLVDDDGPDIVVHAASHRFPYARLHAIPDEEAARVYASDLEAFGKLSSRAVRGMMRRRFGRLVAITSIAGQVGGRGAAHYAAAKAGVEGLVRGIAIDYGRFGITANAVSPGFVETTRLTERLLADKRARLEELTSVGRFATPAEVAAPVVFLCSAAASYVTGTSLLVSGGAHLGNFP